MVIFDIHDHAIFWRESYDGHRRVCTKFYALFKLVYLRIYIFIYMFIYCIPNYVSRSFPLRLHANSFLGAQFLIINLNKSCVRTHATDPSLSSSKFCYSASTIMLQLHNNNHNNNNSNSSN